LSRAPARGSHRLSKIGNAWTTFAGEATKVDGDACDVDEVKVPSRGQGAKVADDFSERRASISDLS
jgi:hypothetical protein